MYNPCAQSSERSYALVILTNFLKGSKKMYSRRYFCQTDLAQSTNPKGTGTDHLMVALVDRILKRLDQNLNTPSVITTMLDWSAAFDRQCQTIGIKKFLEMGVRPSIVRVLTCYLSKRSMSVKFNGNTSRVHHMLGGGP